MDYKGYTIILIATRDQPRETFHALYMIRRGEQSVFKGTGPGGFALSADAERAAEAAAKRWIDQHSGLVQPL